MKKKLVLLLLGLITFSCGVNAAGKQYSIELLIFAQDQPNTEVFDQVESKIVWPRGVTKLSTYKKISSENRHLKNSFSKLVRSENYKPLMHVAWIQSVNANSFSRPVRLSNASGEIRGFFRMQRGHYVHMVTDIEYQPDSFEESVVYRLNEKRRFKLNETHYLDHPKFGMLVRVSPI